MSVVLLRHGFWCSGAGEKGRVGGGLKMCVINPNKRVVVALEARADAVVGDFLHVCEEHA